jgi:hypothetical protein
MGDSGLPSLYSAIAESPLHLTRALRESREHSKIDVAKLGGQNLRAHNEIAQGVKGEHHCAAWLRKLSP